MLFLTVKYYYDNSLKCIHNLGVDELSNNN